GGGGDDRGGGPDGETIAGGQDDGAADRRAVDQRAVATAEILDEDRAGGAPYPRVATRDRVVLDRDLAVGQATHPDLRPVVHPHHAGRRHALDRQHEVPVIGVARDVDQGVEPGGGAITIAQAWARVT